jgi:hypothetical protein
VAWTLEDARALIAAGYSTRRASAMTGYSLAELRGVADTNIRCSFCRAAPVVDQIEFSYAGNRNVLDCCADHAREVEATLLRWVRCGHDPVEPFLAPGPRERREPCRPIRFPVIRREAPAPVRSPAVREFSLTLHAAQRMVIRHVTVEDVRAVLTSPVRIIRDGDKPSVKIHIHDGIKVYYDEGAREVVTVARTGEAGSGE